MFIVSNQSQIMPIYQQSFYSKLTSEFSSLLAKSIAYLFVVALWTAIIILLINYLLKKYGYDPSYMQIKILSNITNKVMDFFDNLLKVIKNTLKQENAEKL